MTALIKIIDSGIGIRKEDFKIIFHEFRQLSEGYRRDYEGLGLGLAISSKIANLIGAEISVNSELGKGSEFTIKLLLPADKDLKFFNYGELMIQAANSDKICNPKFEHPLVNKFGRTFPREID